MAKKKKPPPSANAAAVAYAPTAHWKPAEKSGFSQHDVEIIGDAIVDLINQGIDVTPAVLIDVAKNPGSTLHPYLWGVPTSRMLKEWRLARAGAMYRAVKIVYEVVDPNSGDVTEEECRAFHRVIKEVPPDFGEDDDNGDGGPVPVKKGVIVPFTHVIQTPAYLAQVITQARKEMLALVRKHKYYSTRLPGFDQKFKATWAEILNLIP